MPCIHDDFLSTGIGIFGALMRRSIGGDNYLDGERGFLLIISGFAKYAHVTVA